MGSVPLIIVAIWGDWSLLGDSVRFSSIVPVPSVSEVL